MNSTPAVHLAVATLLSLLATGAVAQTASQTAATPRYDYAGFGVFLADSDGNDADGFNLEGSVALNDRLHVLVEYADGELDRGDGDYEALRLALGVRFPIRVAGGALPTDLVLRAGWVDVEVENADADGLNLEAQIRTMLSDRFELNLGGQYQDLDDGFSDDVRLTLAGLWHFRPDWALRGGFSISDEISTFELGIRYHFGRIF
jgi:hypothetical protein